MLDLIILKNNKKMEENYSSKVTMFFYILKEGDVKEPLNKYIIIPKQLYIIGRSSKECDIVLDEKSLSRKHATLIYNNKNEIIIKDLNSRNGTFINKERIKPNEDISFSINEMLSFGNTNNEIVFYDNTETKKEEDTDKEKEKEYNSQQNNYNSNYEERNNPSYLQKNKSIENKHSKSDETKRNLNNDTKSSYSKKSNKVSYSKKNISRSRSRSKETQKKSSQNFTGLENIIKNLDERYRGENNNYKYYERYNRENRDEFYRNREGFGRERENGKKFLKGNNNYNNRDFERNRRFNDNKDFMKEFENNIDDNGYLKCYVSGYMVLNVKK